MKTLSVKIESIENHRTIHWGKVKQLKLTPTQIRVENIDGSFDAEKLFADEEISVGIFEFEDE